MFSWDHKVVVPDYYLTRPPGPFGNKNNAIIIKELHFEDSRPGVKSLMSAKQPSTIPEFLVLSGETNMEELEGTLWLQGRKLIIPGINWW